ncbi:glycosyltransferase [Treponema pectinovorum]|uniref:glycosyltransferase n=1 Tax=Treponema pectinovorum TaxID=164 RepID=UPI0011CAA7ED|nr:glycosyltransferase [Treponema pectinovorum]
MKIAMFTDAYFPRINGVSVSVKSYAGELTKLGHEVCVVCLEYSQEQQKSAFFDEKESDAKSPFQILRIPSSSILFSKEDRMVRLNTWYYLKKKLDKFAPDIIHLNSEWTIGYLGSIYARHRRIACVYTFHTMWEDYLANYVSFLPSASLRKIGAGVVKYYLKRADEIIAPTQRIAGVVSRYGISKVPDILPTGIPEEKFKYSIARSMNIRARLFSKCPGIKGKKILLFVGRIAKEKNLSFLYEVLKEVQKKDRKTALLFVGDGPYLEELKEIAEKQDLKDFVFFTGYIGGEDLIYFYKMATVFVFPSKTETQGLVTVEAMLSGLPVVAIGELGTFDVMQGDNGGFMVKDDVQEFSEKVNLLLSDQNLRKKKINEALQWGSKWKISNLTPTLIDCYKKALANRISKNLGLK